MRQIANLEYRKLKLFKFVILFYRRKFDYLGLNYAIKWYGN